MILSGCCCRNQILFGLFVCFALLFSGVARARGLKAGLDARLFYRGLNEMGEVSSGPVDRLQTVGVILAPKFQQRFSPTLQTRARFVGILESGSSRSLFHTRAPISGVFIDEAELAWLAAEPIVLTGGTVNQRYLEAPLTDLLLANPWPGRFRYKRLEPASNRAQ